MQPADAGGESDVGAHGVVVERPAAVPHVCATEDAFLGVEQRHAVQPRREGLAGHVSMRSFVPERRGSRDCLFVTHPSPDLMTASLPQSGCGRCKHLFSLREQSAIAPRISMANP